MTIKKTELYSSFWASCDELCGGMDASQCKDYALTLLFMKYVTDKYKGDKDKWQATLQTRIQAEIERITQQLANRVKEREERYSEPLPTIERQMEALSEKVYGHLVAMGLEQ